MFRWSRRPWPKCAAIDPSQHLQDQGHVKVMDFGLAKRLDAVTAGDQPTVDSAGQLTVQGGIVGTPAYMSPSRGVRTPESHLVFAARRRSSSAEMLASCASRQGAADRSRVFTGLRTGRLSMSRLSHDGEVYLGILSIHVRVEDLVQIQSGMNIRCQIRGPHLLCDDLQTTYCDVFTGFEHVQR